MSVSTTSEMLFEYLRSALYDPTRATLDVSRLDADYVMLGKGLKYFVHCFTQYNELATALAKGDLSTPLPPPENELAAPLKNLHASLKHLTWQTQQVASGDYNQRIDFMGEFSDAFNTMVEQLAERQKNLENEIDLSHKKTRALEQSYQLLTNITQQIKQQIIVVDRNTLEILFMNNSAQTEVENDTFYMQRLMGMLSSHDELDGMQNVEIQYKLGQEERYLSVSSYFLDWNKANAEVLVIDDVSVEKIRMKELETHAYRDPMTNLHNRFYSMLTLDRWLDEKKRFVLIFADLDNLKYINDKYGHGEGDKYITNAAKHLKTVSPDAMVSRIGGDEFMLLLPDMGYDEAYARTMDIAERIQNDDYLKDKEYYYSVSFGVVEVGEDNELCVSSVLSLADERMYEHKRMRKKCRQQ